MDLVWAAIGTWGATALGGLAMAGLFLRHHGITQSDRESIGPLRVLPHVGLAVAGYGLWVAYLVTDIDNLAWAATSALGVVFLLGGTMLMVRDRYRRDDLARALAQPVGGLAATQAAVPAPSGRPRVAAEQFIPIWLAGAHGLLGGATLVLVLLERAGVGS